MNYTIGDWKPYKGGKPPEPAPMGAGPKGENPRFNTVGPYDVPVPAGGFQSVINTRAPLDPGKSRLISDVQTPFASYRKTSGDQSRAAFAKALTDTSGNALIRALNTFNTDFRKQAEKSRSEDILAQRQNATDRFRMDVNKNIFDEDTRTRYTEGIKDGSQMFETEKRNEQAKRTAMVLRFLGSLL